MKTVSTFIALVLTVCVGLLFTGCGASAATAADYDLSQMSGTVAYATATRIAYDKPMDYVGKNITIDGKYTKSTVKGTTYHFVYLNDMTACCSASIEFIYDGEKPAINSKIRVSGIYEKYNEGKSVYYHIVAASVTKL
jgi:hypothetical protein